MAKNGRGPEKRPDDKKDEKKKKKGGGAGSLLVILILLAIIALLLYFNDGFGLWGGGDDGTKSGEKSSTEESVTNDDNVSKQITDDGKVTITVSENGVDIDGQSFDDAAAAEKFINGLDKDGVTYVLVDNHAIKSEIDAVKKILDDAGFTYTTETK